MRYGIECGGYCPRDFWAEDGKISSHYPLQALDDPDPGARTLANVDLADGVCIIAPADAAGGTALALEHARATGKPVIQLGGDGQTIEQLITSLAEWIKLLPGGKINVAGPRLSEWPESYQQTRRIFDGLLRSKTVSGA